VGAVNAIRPATGFEVVPGGFLVRKHLEELERADS